MSQAQVGPQEMGGKGKAAHLLVFVGFFARPGDSHSIDHFPPPEGLVLALVVPYASVTFADTSPPPPKPFAATFLPPLPLCLPSFLPLPSPFFFIPCFFFTLSLSHHPDSHQADTSATAFSSCVAWVPPKGLQTPPRRCTCCVLASRVRRRQRRWKPSWTVEGVRESSKKWRPSYLGAQFYHTPKAGPGILSSILCRNGRQPIGFSGELCSLFLRYFSSFLSINKYTFTSNLD